MKKEYVVPDIKIVEFEIKDIITHSLAMGDDSRGQNDVSAPGTWFDGNNAWVNIGGQNIGAKGD